MSQCGRDPPLAGLVDGRDAAEEARLRRSALKLRHRRRVRGRRWIVASNVCRCEVSRQRANSLDPYATGSMRRQWLHGHENVRKRVLIQAKPASTSGCCCRWRDRRRYAADACRAGTVSAICRLIGRFARLRRRPSCTRSLVLPMARPMEVDFGSIARRRLRLSAPSWCARGRRARQRTWWRVAARTATCPTPAKASTLRSSPARVAARRIIRAKVVPLPRRDGRVDTAAVRIDLERSRFAGGARRCLTAPRTGCRPEALGTAFRWRGILPQRRASRLCRAVRKSLGESAF